MQKDKKLKTVILGGFLSCPPYYSSMKSQIEKLSGQEASVFLIPQLWWLGVVFPYGWIPILKRLERTISIIHKSSPNLKVTLIGHSIGGVLGLLYLICPPIGGFKGIHRQDIDHLITLGSPHKSLCRWIHGGSISRMVEKYGGLNGIGHNVRLTCIAGKGVLGNKQGTATEKKAYSIYKTIGGQGEVWGDGIVPVKSSLLPGTNPIVLENIVHFSRSGQAWYGSPEIVSEWWRVILSV